MVRNLTEKQLANTKAMQDPENRFRSFPCISLPDGHCALPSLDIYNMRNIADIISHYQPLTDCQRYQKIVRSAYHSATDYKDGSHYGELTDLTGLAALTNIKHRMLTDPIGRVILETKPRITDETLKGLEGCPADSFGKAYYEFMRRYGFRPSERPLVKYIPDMELAYISQRYKEIHDFLHILIVDDISVKNELTIKWFEMIQLGLPSATLAALITPILSPISLADLATICRRAHKHQFIMNVYFEQHFQRPLNEFREELSNAKK